MKRAICALLLLALSGIASAQLVYPIELHGQPMIRLDNGKIVGCGLRIFGFYQVGGDRPSIIVDTSFSLDESMYGWVKFTSSLGTLQDIKNNNLKSQRVIRGWFKAQGKTATMPIDKKTSPGEDGKSLLYVTSFTSAADLLVAQIAKRTISIGIRVEGENTDRVYSGIVRLTKEENVQMQECFEEFSALVKAK